MLSHIALLSGQVQQLKEGFYVLHEGQTLATKNSHKAVEHYQEFEATLKTQGANFSKRLEKLENEQQ